MRKYIILEFEFGGFIDKALISFDGMVPQKSERFTNYGLQNVKVLEIPPDSFIEISEEYCGYRIKNNSSTAPRPWTFLAISSNNFHLIQDDEATARLLYELGET